MEEKKALIKEIYTFTKIYAVDIRSKLNEHVKSRYNYTQSICSSNSNQIPNRNVLNNVQTFRNLYDRQNYYLAFIKL